MATSKKRQSRKKKKRAKPRSTSTSNLPTGTVGGSMLTNLLIPQSFSCVSLPLDVSHHHCSSKNAYSKIQSNFYLNECCWKAIQCAATVCFWKERKKNFSFVLSELNNSVIHVLVSFSSPNIDTYCPPPKGNMDWCTEPHLAPVSSINS